MENQNLPVKLDIGCGRNKERDFIGLDISQDSHADIIASALKLPLKQDTASVVHCSHLVEHFSPEDVPQFFNEVFRVLITGGRAMIKVDRDWSRGRLLKKDPEHKHRYSVDEIKSMVHKFSAKEVKRKIYFFGLRLRTKIFVELVK